MPTAPARGFRNDQSMEAFDIVKAKAADLKRKRDEKVLRFHESHPDASIREIVRRTETPRMTVYRILSRAAEQTASEMSQKSRPDYVGHLSSLALAKSTTAHASAAPSRNRTGGVGHEGGFTKEQEALVRGLCDAWLESAKPVAKRLLEDTEVVHDPLQRAEREAEIFIILTAGLIGHWSGAKVNWPVGYGDSARIEFSLRLSDLSKALRRLFIDTAAGTAGKEARRP